MIPLEIAEGAMVLWAQGANYTDIAKILSERFGKKISPSIVKSWHENGFPEPWEAFRDAYRARIRAKMIEELADYAIKARKQVHAGLQLIIRTATQEIKKYIDGNSEIKFKSMEALLREFRESLRLYHDLFSDPSEPIQRLMADLTEAEKLEVEATLAMNEKFEEAT